MVNSILFLTYQITIAFTILMMTSKSQFILGEIINSQSEYRVGDP